LVGEKGKIMPKLLDVVALLGDLPEENLRRGQVGTVVEELSPGGFEVEFSDNHGRTYATAAVHAHRLLVLHHEAVAAA
jgi:hypothetical protein